MKLEKMRARKAGRYTLICCLCVVIVEVAAALYLTVFKDVPLKEMLPTPLGETSLMNVTLHVVGIGIFFFFVYFFHYGKDKE